LIGALLSGDSRHIEAYSRVEAARAGRIRACTTTAVLSEVYAALTWQQAQPRQTPEQAAQSIRELIEPPSAIRVLADGHAAALLMADLAAKHHLTALRIHDARHAATALVSGVTAMYTYDPDDWKSFVGDGLSIAGPPSTLQRLQTTL
jgi:predicted nucleic acid-binding protein